MNYLNLFQILMMIILASGQENDKTVYFGSGLSSSSESVNTNDTIIILGGLFSFHDGEKCQNIRHERFQRVEAMVLATQQINDNSSLLPGVTLAFEIRDTCYQVNQALEQSLSFITSKNSSQFGTVQGVSGVAGADISSLSIVTASLFRLFSLPQISYSSTSSILSDKTRFDYFLRTVPPDELQAKAIADLIFEFKWTYVILMYSDDAYGSDGARRLKDELTKSTSSVCIAGEFSISHPNPADSDLYEVVESISQPWISNSTVIVLFGHTQTANAIFKAISNKWSPEKFAQRNITWIGSDSVGKTIDLVHYEMAHGMLATIPRVRASLDFDEYFLSLRPDNSVNPWFNEYWEELFNCSLGGRSGVEPCDVQNQTLSQNEKYRQNSYVPPTIDAVYAFAHAIRDMRQDLCTSINRGLCQDMFTTRLGKRVINGKVLLQYIKNVSFPGVSTEQVLFDKNGDLEGGYDILNLQRNENNSLDYKLIGHWDELPLHRNTSLVIFSDIQWNGDGDGDVPESVCSYQCSGGQYQVNVSQCCWTCRQCGADDQVSNGVECRNCEQGEKPNENRTGCERIEPTHLKWSSAFSIIIIILTIFGIAGTTFVMVVYLYFHNDRLIKASSRELSAVLLCGIMLCYFMPFFFIAKPSSATCAIRRFGVGFCFSICFSALLVKTNRIHRIFNRSVQTTEAPHLISPESQLFFTALLVAVQVVIAMVWLVIERPGTTFVYSKLSTELVCSENPHIGFSVTLAYNLLILIITTYFAFRTRNVPQNFNEAKFINLTMYTLCVLWVAFIPTYFAIALLGTGFQTGALILVVIFSATITLCCLLVPKVYFLFMKHFSDKYQSSTTGHGTSHKHSTTIDQTVQLTSVLHHDSMMVKKQNESIKKHYTNASSQTESFETTTE